MLPTVVEWLAPSHSNVARPRCAGTSKRRLQLGLIPIGGLWRLQTGSWYADCPTARPGYFKEVGITEKWFRPLELNLRILLHRLRTDERRATRACMPKCSAV